MIFFCDVMTFYFCFKSLQSKKKNNIRFRLLFREKNVDLIIIISIWLRWRKIIKDNTFKVYKTITV